MDRSSFQVFTRPNFFELFLKDHLEESLKPAFKYVVRALEGRDPRFWWFSKHRTELFRTLMAVVEAYHLWNHDSSFSERFLDLRRVSARCPEVGGLTTTERMVSLGFLVGVPLALESLRRATKHRALTEEQDFASKLARAVSVALPMIRTTIGIAGVGYSIAFIGNMTSFSSPWLHLAGVKLVSAATSGRQQQQQQVAGGIVRVIGKAIGDSLRLVLPLAAFGYRSLEWWYSMPHAVSGVPSLDAIPPSPDAPRLCSGVTVPAGDVCPLCGKQRTNTAVLATSGFAFCYPCIVPFIRQHSKCPLTGLPTTEDQIRRLFSR